jgi:hypothetical protein
MTPRRVRITIDMITIAPVHELRVRDLWWHALASAKYGWEPEIRRIAVAIVKPEKGGKHA